MSGFLLLFALSLNVLAQDKNTGTKPLEVGAIAPDFTLSSNKKSDFTLSETKQSTVLVFYRGYW